MINRGYYWQLFAFLRDGSLTAHLKLRHVWAVNLRIRLTLSNDKPANCRPQSILHAIALPLRNLLCAVWSAFCQRSHFSSTFNIRNEFLSFAFKHFGKWIFMRMQNPSKPYREKKTLTSVFNRLISISKSLIFISKCWIVLQPFSCALVFAVSFSSKSCIIHSLSAIVRFCACTCDCNSSRFYKTKLCSNWLSKFRTKIEDFRNYLVSTYVRWCCKIDHSIFVELDLIQIGCHWSIVCASIRWDR